MPTSSELITTVIPTYRRPTLLRRAIASALNQTVRAGKVMVYDDASDDETETVVRQIMASDPRVGYHRHERNLGLVANFAYAIEHVETPYFSILSNDDMVLPRFYEAGLRALESHPEAAFASMQVVHVDDSMRVIQLIYPWHEHPGFYSPPNGLLRLVEWAPPAWAGIIFRNSVIQEFGILAAEMDSLMDNDFQLRIAAGRPYVIDATLGAVFWHRRESISGEARLSATWPAWRLMTERLAADPSIPASARDEAVAILNRQLVTRLYGIGVINSRNGNVADAEGAAELLEGRLARGDKARRIRRLSRLYGKYPRLARLHARAADFRGLLKSPATLLDYVARAGDDEALRGLRAGLRGEVLPPAWRPQDGDASLAADAAPPARPAGAGDSPGRRERRTPDGKGSGEA